MQKIKLSKKQMQQSKAIQLLQIMCDRPMALQGKQFNARLANVLKVVFRPDKKLLKTIITLFLQVDS